MAAGRKRKIEAGGAAEAGELERLRRDLDAAEVECDAAERANADLDAALAQGRREREVEEGRERFARSLRHATATRRVREASSTSEQRGARLAEARRGVEAEVRQFDRERQAAGRRA